MKFVCRYSFPSPESEDGPVVQFVRATARAPKAAGRSKRSRRATSAVRARQRVTRTGERLKSPRLKRRDQVARKKTAASVRRPKRPLRELVWDEEARRYVRRRESGEMMALEWPD